MCSSKGSGKHICAPEKSGFIHKSNKRWKSRINEFPRGHVTRAALNLPFLPCLLCLRPLTASSCPSVPEGCSLLPGQTLLARVASSSAEMLWHGRSPLPASANIFAHADALF